jgi:hypothetical protein
VGNRSDIDADLESKDPKGSTEVAYIVDDKGDDRFDWGIDDLREPIKKTMGDYLNCLTAETGNKYKIDPGSDEISYRDPTGAPAAFTVAGSNKESFTSESGLKDWSTDFLDSKSENMTLGSYLSKGKPVLAGTESGHDLLSSVDGGEGITKSGKASVATDGKGNIPQQISQVLRTNRFNPTQGSSPFIEDGEIPLGPGRLRSALGEFDGGVEITYEDISKIALSLMVKATGHDNDGTKDPTASSVTAEQLAPSLLQSAAVKIASNQLNARNAYPLTQFDRVTLESDVTLNFDDPSTKSYGVLNSHVEPFDGFLPLGMVVLSSALIPALIISTSSVFSLLSLIIKFDGSTIPNEPGPYIKGQYGRPEVSSVLSVLIGPKQLGLFQTEHSFADAVAEGVKVFFGYTGSGNVIALLGPAKNVLQSPGYYAVIIRSILRSANTIVDSITNALSAGSFVEGLQAILGLVDVLKSSKVFAYFNMLAQLGDLELSVTDRDTKSIDEISDFAPAVDVKGIVQAPRVNVMKSRIKQPTSDDSGVMSLKLSWRAASSPAMYILPENLLRAGADFGKGGTAAKAFMGTELINKLSVTLPGQRISQSAVELLEDHLEAEYVPFYFHDLRTNEIISFHAFLGSLTDAFTSNYDEVDGYGRMDAVQIYKNTKRAITFSFHVAATSESDFDEMWWKINKLITLLYPQWSSGRQMKGTTGKVFRQPFSQIPTASPMIRLRIGDVIKSNYSKFNLARLFGLGEETFRAGSNHTEKTDVDSDFIDAELTLEAWRRSVGVLKAGDEMLLSITKGKGYEPAPSFGLGDNSSIRAAAVKINYATKVRITKVNVAPPLVDLRGLPQTAAQTYHVERMEVDGKPFINKSGADVSEIVVTEGSLSHYPGSTNHSDFLSEYITADDGSVEEIAAFFSDDSNTIVRSFNSAKGRGLAGVIKSMDFDWHTPTWETDTIGSKAPKYCIVNVSFTPIHDIAPGLDADGANRGPVYPVGRVINDAFGDVRDGKVIADAAEALLNEMPEENI